MAILVSWLWKLGLYLLTKYTEKLHEWVIKLIRNSFLQWYYGIVGNVNVLRTNRGAAFCNVAESNAMRILQISRAVFYVKWVHFQGGIVDHMPRTGEFVMQRMFAQYVTNILAKKALNAFSEFLHPVYVDLRHSPGSIRRVGRTGLKLFDALLDPVVYRYIGDQVFDNRESFHGLNAYGFTLWHVTHAGHAHEFWVSINLC